MVMFLIGFAVGLVVAPLLRSWLLWRQYLAASRRAGSAEEALRHLERDDPRRVPDPIGR